jgi:hypothetical protein
MDKHLDRVKVLKSFLHKQITLFDYHLIGELMENATFCCLSQHWPDIGNVRYCYVANVGPLSG